MAEASDLQVYEAVTPDPIKLRAMRIMRGTRMSSEKIFDSFEELLETVNYLRSVGCKIVLTMGTWDLYHEGHGNYIELAKIAGQKRYPDAEKIILVVGVDSDELTRERKGPKRPVVNESERCRIIRHHEGIDLIIVEREYRHLHRHLPHDLRVISTTTPGLEIDDEILKYCEGVENLPPQAETSTSARVRLLILEGGQEVMVKLRVGMGKLIEEVEHGFSV